MEQQATDIIVASQAAVRQASALAVQYSFSIVGALLAIRLSGLEPQSNAPALKSISKVDRLIP